MAVQSNGFLQGRTLPTPADHRIAHFNPWRASNVGTSAATITVPCPDDLKTGSRVPQLAISTLYCTAKGTNPKVQIKSNSDVIMEYRMLTGIPLQLMYFPGDLTIEPGEDLTIVITGATDDASISATGVVYR